MEDDDYYDEDDDYYDEDDDYYDEDDAGDDSVVKTLKEAKIRLTEMSKAWSENMSGLCQASFYNAQGTCQACRTNGGCHGVLHSMTEKTALVLNAYNGDAFIESPYGSGNNACDKDLQMRFITWFMSDDNPFSKHILERDPSFVYENGFIIDGSCGKTVTLMLCKVLRQTRELPNSIRLWDVLTKAGIDPWVALIAGQRHPTKKDKVNVNITASLHGTAFPSNYNSGWENVIQRKPHSALSENKQSGICAEVWFSSAKAADPFQENSVVIVDNGWGGPTRITGVTDEQLIEICQKFEKKLQDSIDEPKMKEKTTINVRPV